MKQEIHIDQGDVAAAIHQALIVANADIVVNQNDILVASYDGHYWELNNKVRIELCLSHYLNFIRNGQYTYLPAKVGREFVKRALQENWFKYGYRGPCPGCVSGTARA